MGFFKANTLWRDARYYLDRDTGEYKSKYVLILAVSPDCDDSLSAVLTSKANGLREEPACDPGPPRAGYYLGVPGAGLYKPTWVDFSSAADQDAFAFKKMIAVGRISPEALVLPAAVFCDILRCLSHSEDINTRQHKWLAATIAALGCA
ncbi:hypothetical protein HNQ51_000131 [Inhella inkyongensis]|uniref:Uncharacterized protein n=1 Tax=Inhella inkyongensis TaxID=392593 RepID=A0A840S0D5_9BURK|nr:hypothetical protein [Inhella inkyongensis]MBB5202838.1 hypothetical protein [Inhella inkyongensis]